MKLSKKILFLAMSFVTLGAVIAAAAVSLSKAPQGKQAAKVQEVAAEDGYTVYYAGDLGFATRDPNDTRIVLGDADHGEQTVGTTSLAAKSEQRFSFKKTRSNYWMGVGGYAVYVSENTTIRFLYLGYSTSGNYSRNAEINNLVLKTADGSTALTSVTGDNILFSNYTTAVIRFDLSNPSAVKAHFHVVFNGVEYYTFNGSTLIDTVTYTHQCSGFADSYLDKAMCGYNGTTGGLSIIKFETYDNIKNAENLIVPGTRAFNYSYISDFFFDLNFTEQFYPDGSYLNDHLTHFKNYSGQAINLGDGIVINGKTFRYWVNSVDEDLSYPSSNGVHSFPLNAGNVYAPVALEVQVSKLCFKFNTRYFPSDSIVITLKAGLFEGYYNGNTYVLPKDLTFKSSLDSVNVHTAGENVIFSQQPAETVQQYKITDPQNWGEKTAAGGAKYTQYVLWTNVPRSASITDGVPADHYRYIYENILVNGKTILYYNAWARANSKDFTDLANNIQNPDYETTHPTGSANKIYDQAMNLTIATDQVNYVIFVNIPNQLVTDLSLGTLSFELRDGSAWVTPDGVIRINCAPADRYVVEEFVENEMHMFDYTSEQGYCADAEHHYYITAKEAFNALTSEQQAAFQNANCFKPAKARYEAWAAANGDANPYDNINGISSSNILSSIDVRNNTFVIVIVATITILCATSIVIVIKKRKVN